MNRAGFRQRLVAIGAALLGVACHGPSTGGAGSRRAPAGAAPSARASSTSAVASASPAPSASSATPASPAHPPANPLAPLVITNRVAGQFEIRANFPLELSTKAEIEAQGPNGTWSAYSDLDGGRGYRLRESCSEALPTCRTLTAGEQLNLAPWTGSSCSAQCASACPLDRFHPGAHRLVLHGCGATKGRYEGPAFEMAPSARALWRWRAAEGIQSGRVFRLEPHVLAKAATDLPPEYIANFRVIKDSGHGVPPDLLVELAQWLRSPDAFVQFDLHKRCLEWHLVGLLLEVEARRPDERKVEIALNLGCDRAFITLSDGRGRNAQVSEFDPSEARIFSIMRRALPLDSELAALRENPVHTPANLDHQD